jgi:hypothetical protein
LQAKRTESGSGNDVRDKSDAEPVTDHEIMMEKWDRHDRVPGGMRTAVSGGGILSSMIDLLIY